jgi:hypothetical protein
MIIALETLLQLQAANSRWIHEYGNHPTRWRWFDTKRSLEERLRIEKGSKTSIHHLDLKLRQQDKRWLLSRLTRRIFQPLQQQRELVCYAALRKLMQTEISQQECIWACRILNYHTSKLSASIFKTQTQGLLQKIRDAAETDYRKNDWPSHRLLKQHPTHSAVKLEITQLQPLTWDKKIMPALTDSSMQPLETQIKQIYRDAERSVWNELMNTQYSFKQRLQSAQKRQQTVKRYCQRAINRFFNQNKRQASAKTKTQIQRVFAALCQEGDNHLLALTNYAKAITEKPASYVKRMQEELAFSHHLAAAPMNNWQQQQAQLGELFHRSRTLMRLLIPSSRYARYQRRAYHCLNDYVFLCANRYHADLVAHPEREAQIISILKGLQHLLKTETAKCAQIDNATAAWMEEWNLLLNPWLKPALIPARQPVATSEIPVPSASSPIRQAAAHAARPIPASPVVAAAAAAVSPVQPQALPLVVRSQPEPLPQRQHIVLNLPAHFAPQAGETEKLQGIKQEYRQNLEALVRLGQTVEAALREKLLSSTPVNHPQEDAYMAQKQEELKKLHNKLFRKYHHDKLVAHCGTELAREMHDTLNNQYEAICAVWDGIFMLDDDACNGMMTEQAQEAKIFRIKRHVAKGNKEFMETVVAPRVAAIMRLDDAMVEEYRSFFARLAQKENERIEEEKNMLQQRLEMQRKHAQQLVDLSDKEMQLLNREEQILDQSLSQGKKIDELEARAREINNDFKTVEALLAAHLGNTAPVQPIPASPATAAAASPVQPQVLPLVVRSQPAPLPQRQRIILDLPAHFAPQAGEPEKLQAIKQEYRKNLDEFVRLGQTVEATLREKLLSSAPVDHPQEDAYMAQKQEELKKLYTKLLRQYHHDKLIAHGGPELAREMHHTLDNQYEIIRGVWDAIFIWNDDECNGLITEQATEAKIFRGKRHIMNSDKKFKEDAARKVSEIKEQYDRMAADHKAFLERLLQKEDEKYEIKRQQQQQLEALLDREEQILDQALRQGEEMREIRAQVSTVNQEARELQALGNMLAAYLEKNPLAADIGPTESSCTLFHPQPATAAASAEAVADRRNELGN